MKCFAWLQLSIFNFDNVNFALYNHYLNKDFLIHGHIQSLNRTHFIVFNVRQKKHGLEVTKASENFVLVLNIFINCASVQNAF